MMRTVQVWTAAPFVVGKPWAWGLAQGLSTSAAVTKATGHLVDNAAEQHPADGVAITIRVSGAHRG